MTVAELPLEGAGARLLRAREAKGLSRAQLASLTKIPERHLTAIEQGNFTALPASMYAVAFSRSYARAVGLDERQIADEVRAELVTLEPASARRATPAFEPGDPARVPSARFAWLAGLLAVLVVVLGFVFWRSYYLPGGDLPSILPSEAPVVVVASPPPAAVPASGVVVFTALEPAIWVKFYDGAGTQLLQKDLAQGESYTVPADVTDVRLWTARPEALAITVGGQTVPKLADEQRMMKDIPVTAAALLARQTTVAPAAAAIPAPEASQASPRRDSGTTRPRASNPAVRPTIRPVEAQPVPQATSSPVVQPLPPSPATADR